MITNALRLPAASANSGFTDVGRDHVYYNTIMKAKSTELLDSFTDGEFKPNQPITREEIASIIVAAAKHENIIMTMEYIDLEVKFKDYSDMDASRQNDVQTVYKLKIMQGISSDMFAPKGVTTRAQAATVLINMTRAFGLID